MSIALMALVVGPTLLETQPRMPGKGVMTANDIMKPAVAIAFMGLVLIQLGCATSSGPYPTGWASIESSATQDGCPHLRGTYSNQGSASSSPEVGPQPLLADFFMSMAGSKGSMGPAAWKQTWPAIPHDVSSISIEQTTDMMTVTFSDTNAHRTSLNFRRFRFNWSETRVDDLFQCLTMLGRPELRFFAEVESHGIVFFGIGGGGTVVHLLKSVDGSLIVRRTKSAFVLTPILLGSGVSVDDTWYRYPLVEPEGPAK